MRVCVAHSKDFDFRTELYGPIRESRLNGVHDFVLPHEHSEELFSSKGFFRDECDAIVVEATFPKIGIGIEVGWADAYDVPIIAMHRKGTKLSGSLRPMCREVIGYDGPQEMISKLEGALGRL
jgi:hypothetical protein